MEKEKGKKPAGGPPSKEEEEEEEKMKEFFNLIRSIKATRECWRNESSEMKKKRKVKEECRKAVWVPCFEREDFTNKIEFKAPLLNPPTSSTTSRRMKDESLDLNLSL